MKNHVLAIALLLACGLAVPLATAADGTITLTGEITGTTCTISGGTGGVAGSGANFPVVLDKVQASALPVPGLLAGTGRGDHQWYTPGLRRGAQGNHRTGAQR